MFVNKLHLRKFSRLQSVHVDENRNEDALLLLTNLFTVGESKVRIDENKLIKLQSGVATYKVIQNVVMGVFQKFFNCLYDCQKCQRAVPTTRRIELAKVTEKVRRMACGSERVYSRTEKIGNAGENEL